MLVANSKDLNNKNYSEKNINLKLVFVVFFYETL